MRCCILAGTLAVLCRGVVVRGQMVSASHLVLLRNVHLRTPILKHGDCDADLNNVVQRKRTNSLLSIMFYNLHVPEPIQC